MQSELPDIHIIGHWNYPTNTVKTVYVAANHCDAVELFVNEKSLGKSSSPVNGYVFAFPQVKFEAGKISAVATAKGKIVAQDKIETASEAKKLKLTLHVSPNGFQADGSDVALFNVEVVDAARPAVSDLERNARGFHNSSLLQPSWRGGYRKQRQNQFLRQ